MSINKSTIWVWITGNATVIQNPCYINEILVTPKSAKKTTLSIYNSRGSTDNLIMTVQCPTGSSKFLSFSKPLYCSNGLYIVVDGDLIGVLIVYDVEPLSGKDKKE